MISVLKIRNGYIISIDTHAAFRATPEDTIVIADNSPALAETIGAAVIELAQTEIKRNITKLVVK